MYFTLEIRAGVWMCGYCVKAIPQNWNLILEEDGFFISFGTQNYPFFSRGVGIKIPIPLERIPLYLAD
jgi:hypothetical protein